MSFSIENKYSIATADRIRRASNDPFFLKGDILSNDGSLTFFYEGPQECVEETNSMTKPNKVGEEDETLSKPYPCTVATCSKRFSTLKECEEHYKQSHMYECIECGRVLPSEYLLDLHIQEAHDAFFSVSVDKYPNKLQYKCLVPACPHSFRNEDDRAYHLRTDHSFPKWFRFHLKHTIRHEIPNIQTENNHLRSEPLLNNFHTNDEQRIEQKRLKRRERKERKKEKYSQTPCKFYFPPNGPIGGCKRGKSCMFSHSISPEIGCKPISFKKDEIEEATFTFLSNMNVCTNVDKMDIPMIDALSNTLQQKMRVSVPDKISFGGKKSSSRLKKGTSQSTKNMYERVRISKA